MNYTLQRVVNNNSIVALDENRREVILMGKGIGVNWHQRKGQLVPSHLIEKTFVLKSDKQLPYFEEILRSIPLHEIDTVNNALYYAREKLAFDFKDYLFLTLLDHIRFAKERFHRNEVIQNPFLHEIRQFHPKEYETASEMVQYVNEQLSTDFDENEAGFIAFHLINAISPLKQEVATKIIKISAGVVGVIEEYYHKRIDKESVYYSRLLTHLKYFLNRVLLKPEEDKKREEVVLFHDIQTHYEQEWDCALTVKSYLKQRWQLIVSNEELNYLMIHIIQLVK